MEASPFIIGLVSDSDEDAIIGRAVRQYVEAKRRLAAVRAELHAWASVFRELAPAFELKGDEPLDSSECSKLLRRMEEREFSLEKLRSLLAENDELSRRITSTRQTLRASGLDA